MVAIQPQCALWVGVRDGEMMLGAGKLEEPYPHPELNGDPRFRKPLLYPFELWGLNLVYTVLDFSESTPFRHRDGPSENQK